MLIFSEDKPADCVDCEFWNMKTGRCKMDGVCYYACGDDRSHPCYACPYKKNGPCIGWCTKDLLGRRGVAAHEKLRKTKGGAG